MGNLSFIEHVLQILRDPVAQGLSAILAAFGVAISILMLRRDRMNEKKELSIVILTNMSLFSASPLIKDKLRVMYEDREISDLSMIHFVVRNSGRQPILPEDFYSPFLIRLSPGSTIAEAEIVSLFPDNLTASVKQSGSHIIEITKALMNPGDSIQAKILVAGNDGSFYPEARIAGISKLVTRDRTTPSNTDSGLATVAILFSAVVVGVVVNLIAQVNAMTSWIIALSLSNFAVFGYDKALAKLQRRRVPELLMHLISIGGGALGAILGMIVFRHKTHRVVFWILNIPLSILLIVFFFLYG